MSEQPTSPDTCNATSSPGSADGPMRSDSPDGPTTGPSGPAPVRARRSARRERNDAQGALMGVSDFLQMTIRSSRNLAVHRADGATSEIYGLSSEGSLRAHALSESLVSRLRAHLDVNGSLEYALIWIDWGIPAQPSISALRASARRTSGSGSTGWPTPMAAMPAQNGNNEAGDTCNSRRTKLLVGWATPSANNYEQDDQEALERRRAECKRRTGNGNGFGLTLGNQARLSPASTGNRGALALNPAFSLWLMGFGIEWLMCAQNISRKP